MSCEVIAESGVPHFTAGNIDALDMDRMRVRVGDDTAAAKRREQIELIDRGELPESTEPAEPKGPPGAMDCFFIAAKKFDIGAWPILRAQNATESDGGTFGPLQFVQGRLTDAEFNDFGQRLLDVIRSEGGIAYPGSDRLTERLQEARSPHLGLTFGVEPLWQGIKAVGGNCLGITEIMGTSKKGPHVANWRGPDNTITARAIDPLTGKTAAICHAQSVRVIDDKNTSLENMHPDDRGLLIVHEGEKRLPSQGPSKLPERLKDQVRVIHHLDEITVDPRIERAACDTSGAPLPEGPLAYYPLYAGHESASKILVVPNMSFLAIREAIERPAVRALVAA